MLVHKDWLLTPERAAVHLPTATAVVADLHLAYYEARRRRGESVPSTDLETVLAPLGALLARQEVRRLIFAGDLFEEGPQREVADELVSWLAQSSLEKVLAIPGNHDRRLGNLHGIELSPRGCLVGSWLVTHGDGRLRKGFVVHGHWHPCLRWSDRVVAPCFLIRPGRIVLPAFSQDAAGVNALSEHGWGSYRCCVIVGEAVLDFGRLSDLPRRRPKRPGRRS